MPSLRPPVKVNLSDPHKVRVAAGPVEALGSYDSISASAPIENASPLASEAHTQVLQVSLNLGEECTSDTLAINANWK